MLRAIILATIIVDLEEASLADPFSVIMMVFIMAVLEALEAVFIMEVDIIIDESSK
jgi:hypothetical protein